MKNLACSSESTRHCRDELLAAGVPVVVLDSPCGEPQSWAGGQLGHFMFRRAWCYWIVTGRVPLAVAERLYADPVGRRDIRVAGHGHSPPPIHPWVEWYDADGRHLIADPTGKQETQWRDLLARRPEWLDDSESTAFVADPSTVPGARGYVECYHVDSQEGLQLIADALRECVGQPPL